MDIDWAALGSVFGVSLVVTVALVGVFTLGIVSLARREAAVAQSESAALATTGACVCFALCVGAVGYGIQLIVA
ncbi:hypothetical protein HUT18_04750 [Streptomyces sp. NA04227]|uniref:hypothetical protein n=1 Tax=Streptomyces sp. NA04227 TaxID=2742136 RepID=UPI001591D12A|nr:hypothetical protein [Streptomyces sp. NA04227]QKW05790.1 hypothetical protein HUT18_04750 [Streptomyces sp. NA04227]